MSDYCEKCKRCHDDGLRDDEECIYYGEPNGCNHPNHGYGVIVDKYEALQKENAELRECLRKFYELEFPMGYEGVGGEWLDLAKETEKALAKSSGEEAK